MRFPFQFPAGFGGAREGAGEVPEPPAPAGVSNMEAGEPYRLECRRGAMWLGPLTGVFDASRTRKLNAWETLEFSVLQSHGQAANLRGGCEVWVWRAATLVGRYWVVRAVSAAGAERTLSVTAASGLWRLSLEGVGVYNARTRVIPADPDAEPYYEPVTLRAAVTGLLALQTQTPPVTLGAVSAAIGNTPVNLRLMGKTVEEWLRELRKVAGGWYEVDQDLKLHWRTTPSALRGASTGLWLRDGKNLLGLRHTVDYGNYANRVVAIGAGGWYENSLIVTRNNAGAQAALGRIVTAVVVDRAMKDTATLTLWADRVLAERSRPQVGLDLEVVDLGALHSGLLSDRAAAFECGSTVEIVTEAGGGLTGTAWVVEARHSLDTPSDVQVNLGEPDAVEAAEEDAGTEGLLDAVAALAAKLKAVEGEVDGELEEEFARLRDALASGASDIWDALAEQWAEALAEELGADPYEGGPLADALEEWFGSGADGSGPTDHEERIQALEEGGGAPSPGTPILPVTSGTSVDGTADTFARADHQHQGVPIVLSGDPPSSGEALKFEGGKLYMAVGSGGGRAWLLISHLEAEEEEEEE